MIVSIYISEAKGVEGEGKGKGKGKVVIIRNNLY